MADIRYCFDAWECEGLPYELEDQTPEGWAAFFAAGPRWNEDDEREPSPADGEILDGYVWTYNRTMCRWQGDTVVVTGGDPLAEGDSTCFAFPYLPGIGWDAESKVNDLRDVPEDDRDEGEFEIASWNDAMSVPTKFVFRVGPPPTLTPIAEVETNG